jgi:hypothetical protein
MAKSGPIPYATNPVGMENCAETMMQGFSDRLSVLVPSHYAYQEALSLVPANMSDADAVKRLTSGAGRRFPRRGGGLGNIVG